MPFLQLSFLRLKVKDLLLCNSLTKINTSCTDKAYIHSSEGLTKNVEKLHGCGKNYFVVAIIGVQNSGKSTLLNYLFGTEFEVLTEKMGTRTTRGIFVSLDKESNLIIMDVDGNDSLERAAEQVHLMLI